MIRVVRLVLLFALLCLPLHAQERQHRVVDWKYIAVNAANAGMVIWDTTMTAQCIRAGTCVEGNPLVPKTRGGQLSLGFFMVGADAASSYLLKKMHVRRWWLLPALGVGMHAYGVSTGYRCR